MHKYAGTKLQIGVMELSTVPKQVRHRLFPQDWKNWKDIIRGRCKRENKRQKRGKNMAGTQNGGRIVTQKLLQAVRDIVYYCTILIRYYTLLLKLALKI